MPFLQSHKKKIFAILLALNLSLFIGYDFSVSLLTDFAIAALAIAFGLYTSVFAVQLIKKEKVNVFTTNMIISLLLLLSVVDIATSGFVLLFLGVITGLLKTFFRVRNQPLFNPIAAGILAMSLLWYVPIPFIQEWTIFPYWAGAGFGQQLVERIIGLPLTLNIVLLLVITWFVIQYFNKLWIISIGLISAAVTIVLLKQSVGASIFVLEGTFLFFAATMMTEPKSSPAIARQQQIFGAFVGASSQLFISLGFIAPYCLALILGNAGFKAWQHWTLQQRLKAAGKLSQ